jgi:hypothetical protein
MIAIFYNLGGSKYGSEELENKMLINWIGKVRGRKLVSIRTGRKEGAPQQEVDNVNM